MSIGRVCNDIAHDDDVRGVVLTGAGKGFCAGINVTVLNDIHNGVYGPTRLDKEQPIGYPHADAFTKLNKPVIAAINGACMGGGLSMALSCDIRIASENAKFGAAQVAWGLVPDYGMTMLLPLAVGLSNTFKLMFTADIIGVADAKEMGIVSQVVSLEQLMSVVMELATKIASQPPYSVELAKKLVWRSRLDDITRALDLETLAQEICFKTEDHKVSVAAFLNKQSTPKYQGK
jgi:enoyl-CoA hydratase/carnithine racemase